MASDGVTKYIAPGLRGRVPGETSGERSREDNPYTLRVTNLSEDVTENDVHRLFGRFGDITRCYVACDRETGECKGFAFVAFRSESDAERAMGALNGYGYDNLILRVEKARPQQ